MGLWIETGLGRYDASTKKGWTLSTIDSAYDSYHTVISKWLLRFEVPPDLRSQLNQIARDYYWQLSIDSRQDPEPTFEKPEKTICRACQYAQASLVRDLRRLYPSLAKVLTLKAQVDEIMGLRPEAIALQLSPPGTDLSQFGVSYIDIRDPASAAKILGLLNSTDTLLDYTAHYTLMDDVLLKRMSEASALNPS